MQKACTVTIPAGTFPKAVQLGSISLGVLTGKQVAGKILVSATQFFSAFPDTPSALRVADTIYNHCGGELARDIKIPSRFAS